MAGRRSPICFGIFLGTTRLRSRRQHSQVARQASLSIMANTVVAFNAPPSLFCRSRGAIPPCQDLVPVLYQYLVHAARQVTTACSSKRWRTSVCVRRAETH